MLAATILHSLSAVCVLLIVIGFGVFLARKGWFVPHRTAVSFLNSSTPLFRASSFILLSLSFRTGSFITY